jgi:uncharacterized protein YjiK
MMGVFLHKLLSKFLPCSLALVLLASCELIWSPHSPRGYVLPRPDRVILAKKVNEISGLSFLSGDSALLTIADNKQKIFQVTPDGMVSNYFEEDFAEQQDFEDIVKVGETIYALVSNGSIISVRKTDSGLLVTNHPFWSTEKNDFETLYYDSTAGGLIMVCKSCAFEKGKGVRTAFRFDLATLKFDTQPFYAIAIKEVHDILKDGKVDFNPSAAAIHPIEKRLYIMSSAGQLLVISDLRGRVQEAYRLKPNFYPQAEGIAFASNGDMYVSNEAKLGKPSLLKITYKHK